jgi:hypothetical protein
MNTDYAINISTVEQLRASQQAHYLQSTYNTTNIHSVNEHTNENVSSVINTIYKFIKYYASTIINYNYNDTYDDTYNSSA